LCGPCPPRAALRPYRIGSIVRARYSGSGFEEKGKRSELETSVCNRLPMHESTTVNQVRKCLVMRRSGDSILARKTGCLLQTSRMERASDAVHTNDVWRGMVPHSRYVRHIERRKRERRERLIDFALHVIGQVKHVRPNAGDCRMKSRWLSSPVCRENESRSFHATIFRAMLISHTTRPSSHLQRILYAASLFPSLTSFNAFMVPWRACLWFLRNLGSVPLREGYLWVLGL